VGKGATRFSACAVRKYANTDPAETVRPRTTSTGIDQLK
jgi:hypothetical protein